MSARTELFAYLAAAIGTVVGLFVLQQWYGSYLDVSYHESFAEVPRNPELEALRTEEEQRREQEGLAAAKKKLAQQGRGSSQTIAPQPSEDLSAMNGWIHRPGFAPYTPRQSEPAEEPAQGESPEGIEGEAGDEGAAPGVQGAAAAPSGQTQGAAEAAPATGNAAAKDAAPQRKAVKGVTVEASGQVPRPSGAGARRRVPSPGAAEPIERAAEPIEKAAEGNE